MRVTTACIGEAMTPDLAPSLAAAALEATLCSPAPRNGWVGRLAPRARAEPVMFSTMSSGTVSLTRRLFISMTNVSDLDLSGAAGAAAPGAAAKEAGWPEAAEAGVRFRYVRSSHLVDTANGWPCSAVKSSLRKISLNSGIGVGTPSITSSSSTRRTRATASRRFWAVTMTLPIIESNFGEMVSPCSTPVSMRTPGPAGHWIFSKVPEPGVRLVAGSSLVMRSSKLWPRSSGARVSSPPAAILSCSRTRSRPLTSSETVCSTCKRGLTSRKYTLPFGVTMNSQVPRPT